MIPSPSPSVKIQIIGGKGKKLLGIVNQLENKNFVDITKQCFALLPQVNFPANNLNFHWRWRWWDHIQAIFLNFFDVILQFSFEIGQEDWKIRVPTKLKLMGGYTKKG